MIVDALTILRIDDLHPRVRKETLQLYMKANNTLLGSHVRLRFSQVLRTMEQQQKLYEQGRTTAGKIVTNAKAEQSYHNYGLAFDIVLLYDDGSGRFSQASWDIERGGDWKRVAEFFKAHGWEWGGDWRSPDYPHFQKSFGCTWQDLQKAEKDIYGYPII